MSLIRFDEWYKPKNEEMGWETHAQQLRSKYPAIGQQAAITVQDINQSADRLHKYEDLFQQTFGVPLRGFWGRNGFDIGKFNREFVRSNNPSVEKAVYEKWGFPGLHVIKLLTTNIPDDELEDEMPGV